MTQLAEYLVHARVWLETQVGVAAPAGALVALVFLSQYLVRRFIPGVWESMANLPFPGGAHKPAVALLRKAWQALPSAVTGAFLGALAYGDDATAAVIGAIVGLIAPVGHEAAKAMPIPYQGGKPPAAEVKSDPAGEVPASKVGGES
jgi:hypothetical protein